MKNFPKKKLFGDQANFLGSLKMEKDGRENTYESFLKKLIIDVWDLPFQNTMGMQ